MQSPNSMAPEETSSTSAQSGTTNDTSRSPSPASMTNGTSPTSEPSTILPRSLSEYRFPIGRLKPVMDDPTRTPLCLVACGSFSPITYLHLRMFEMAADYAKFNTEFEVIGGYLSPVSDAYKKAGLASAQHRIAMCDIATTRTSKWITVDPWEALQDEYQPTAVVLDHFEKNINTIHKGLLTTPDGPRKHVRIALLAGADLIQTMSTPGVWSKKDLDHILGRYGSFILERSGTDINFALAGLQPWKENIWVIQQLIQNDVSSTKIRQFLRRDMSVKYLIPGPVIDYIEANGLYEDHAHGAPPHDGKGRVSTKTPVPAALQDGNSTGEHS